MVNKNKNQYQTITNLSQTISHLGFAAMFAATVFGMAELAEREGHKAVAVMQPHPVYAYVNEFSENGGNAENTEMMRRGGREEIHNHSATFSTSRRSHSVTGTL